MKIAIDVQTTLGQKTGFGFYVENLVNNLKKYDGANDYSLIQPKKDVDLSTPERFMWDQFRFPSIAKHLHADILHQPCFSAPVFHNKMKVVVTIHDLIAIRFGKDIPFFSRQFFGRWMPFSYRFADKIIAVSEHTKKDIVKFLHVPENKIQVIYSAVSENFNDKISKDEVVSIKKKYHTGEKYFLHTGTLNPRKNLEFLVKVYAEILKSNNEYNLVITGKKGWYYEGLFSLIKNLGLEKKVIFTGYIPDEDAPILYKGASIFLFPSLYEGFGFPPLEAMATGTPVISSNTSSLPEVVGKAGILISPHLEADWVYAVKKLIDNKNLHRQMSLAGLDQAKKFSWKKCALETLDLYKKTLGTK